MNSIGANSASPRSLALILNTLNFNLLDVPNFQKTKGPHFMASIILLSWFHNTHTASLSLFESQRARDKLTERTPISYFDFQHPQQSGLDQSELGATGL